MKVLSTLFSMKGRTGRLHYLLHHLIEATVVIAYLAAFLAVPAGGAAQTAVVTGLVILLLVEGASEICVTVRRLHDLDRPGTHWWLLPTPFVGFRLSLALIFNKGTEGPNRFGDDPLAGHGAPVPGRVR